jgi:hypothetical protein
VALAISILSYYPEGENALSLQDWRKEKYMEVEHSITELGDVIDEFTLSHHHMSRDNSYNILVLQVSIRSGLGTHCSMVKS